MADCSNNLVQPLLTDKYQISMCYAYWKDKKHLDVSVFDVYFRKNPFKGEYTIFCGLDRCISFIENFKFSDGDLGYLRSIPDYAHIEEGFWQYLSSLDTKSIKLNALREGSVCFPNLPLLQIEGPLGILQLLETTLLNCVNYASLVSTNAARLKFAARSGTRLFEFGLRRAQGPDGAMSASRYSYVGGFDSTSNLLAGKCHAIPVTGTHAHAFILSYYGSPAPSKENKVDHRRLLNTVSNQEEDFTGSCLDTFDEFVKLEGLSRVYRAGLPINSDKSELKAMISYACAFPKSFLALVDTYDVIKSGLANFCVVAITLLKFGYKPVGIRIDSGDLAYLSRFAKELFAFVARAINLGAFDELEIIASNDINEQTINSLNDQPHAITGFGIGTHLVTCQEQPALGCVCKLVEANGQPCMKVGSTPEKGNLPCKKSVFRLYGRDGHALIDLMVIYGEPAPKVGEKILCLHPFQVEKRCLVTPSRVESILECWWDGKKVKELPTLSKCRDNVKESLAYLTQDIKRSLNPTPYKVSVSPALFDRLNKLKNSLTIVGELC